MRILAGAVLALLVLAGCSSSEPSADAPTVEVCPPEYVDLPQTLTQDLPKKVETEQIRVYERYTNGVGFGNIKEFQTLLKLSPSYVFEFARWIDLYPACFTPEATVLIYAFRDSLNAGLGTPSYKADEMSPLLEILYMPPGE
jgi:hypothetical protein